MAVQRGWLAFCISQLSRCISDANAVLTDVKNSTGVLQSRKKKM